MTYAILGTGVAQSDRLAVTDGAFIHLSTGDAVWLAMNTATGKVGLWVTADKSSTASEVLADVAVDTVTWSGSNLLSNHLSPYALARDASDNIYIYSNQNQQIRCLVKGAGLTWTPNPSVKPSQSTVMGNYASMVWCDTGDTGHLLLLGPANGTGGPWMTVDCGPLVAGTGTPAGQSGLNGPFGSLSFIIGGSGDNPTYSTDIAANGIGATSGLAISSSYQFPSRNLGVGSWSVAANGTPTFTYRGNAGSSFGRARVVQVANNRYAVTTSTGPGISLWSATGQLVAASAPDEQITDWPYPTFGAYEGSTLVIHPEWDLAVDRPRRKVWFYAAAPADPAMYRLGVDLTGDQIVWDVAVTVDDPDFGIVHAGNDTGRRGPHLRLVRHQVNSTADYQANHFTSINTVRALRGSSSIYNQPPLAPALTFPVGVTVNREITNRFEWTFADPDPGDSQSRYDLQVRPQGSGTLTLDVTQETANPRRDIVGGTLPDAALEWRVRTYDQIGEQGPWSAWTAFTSADAPDGPTITAPVNNATVAAETSLIEWSAAEQDRYQVRTVADDGGAPDIATVYYDSGAVSSSSARSLTVPFPTTGRHEHVQVRVERNTLWSEWASARVEVNYDAPAVPAIFLLVNEPVGAFTVSASHPTPSGAQPTVTAMHVRRRLAGDPASAIYLKDGYGISPTATFVDWTPNSGVEFEYQVQVVGANGTSTFSVWSAGGPPPEPGPSTLPATLPFVLA